MNKKLQRRIHDLFRFHHHQSLAYINNSLILYQIICVICYYQALSGIFPEKKIRILSSFKSHLRAKFDYMLVNSTCCFTKY